MSNLLFTEAGSGTVRPDYAMGGDILISPGRGYTPPGKEEKPYNDGSIIFNLADQTEFLRLGPEGCFVRGEKMTSNAAVWAAFKIWLQKAGISK